MFAIHIALSVIFIVIGLKPLSESAKYRFQKTAWTLVGFALLGTGLINLWLQNFWVLIIGGLLVLLALRFNYD